MKYLLAILTMLVVSSTFGQFNQNRRPIREADTVDYHTAIVEQKQCTSAEFPGGMAAFYKYISKKLKYPRDAKQQNVKGRVFVEFAIDTIGNVRKESVRVVKSLFESCDNEAVRLIKGSPRWIPAVDMATNRKMEVIYVLPILFVK